MNYKAIAVGLVSFAIAFVIFQVLYIKDDRRDIKKAPPFRKAAPFKKRQSEPPSFQRNCTDLKCPQHIYTKQVPYYEKKREIAQKLADIYIRLQNAVQHSKPPTPKTLLELKGIISELDPAHKLSTDHREAVDPKPNNSSVLLDVCPEKYMGEKYSYPYYEKGWVMQDCKNVNPLNKVVSIVINTMAYPQDMEKQVNTVLQGINHTYPHLKVFLAAKTNEIEASAKKYPNVKAITVSKSSSLGKVWNQLISEVSTPYTLVARDVVHFTWIARIERQIRLISTTEHVGIAGGSFRNLTGHWRIGCRQTKLFNYVLQYEEGYHYSRDSCMFCDDLEGPFVAKTDLLKKLPFSEKYNKEVIFEEFFLRVSRAGNLIMNCPDSMYFTTDYSTEAKHLNKAIWQPLVTDLKLVRVVFVDYNVRHKFSCSDISFKCEHSITRYVALPKCCLEQFESAMKLFNQLAIENNVLYETDSGSTLACVKFNNYCPFDIDGDLIVLSFNFSIMHSKASLVSEKGFRMTSYKAAALDSNGKIKTGGSFGYLDYKTPDINIEVWGYPYTSADKFSPPELNKNSHLTKCRLGDIWINCVHFPAWYSRNRYGPDILKHSQSWRFHGKITSFSRYASGSFIKCNDPTFHSCLDKFPGDGNIAFKVV